MSDHIFISSVQKELADERRAIRDFIRGDALLRRFFEVFLFEDLPASDRRADDVYLDEVGRCAIYVGLFGQEYGYEDATGLSPTEREFNEATTLSKPRFIYVKSADDHGRHPKMRALISKAGAQLIRRRFTGTPDLTAALYASLVEHLERTGRLRTRPFDAAACPDATLADIAEDKVKWFLGIAGRERQYPLREDTPPAEALAHLNLLDADQPSHAAVLLFGRQPQRFLLTSEVKCMHADPMFLARYAEKAGSGILDMIARCKQAGLAAPEFRQDGGQFIQTLLRPNPAVTPQVDFSRNLLKEESLQELAGVLGLATPQVTPQVAVQVAVQVEKVLNATAGEVRSREELQTAAGMIDREHFRKAYVEPLVTAGWLERTIPGKPTSRLQKYRLTAKGRAWLADAMKGGKPPLSPTS